MLTAFFPPLSQQAFWKLCFVPSPKTGRPLPPHTDLQVTSIYFLVVVLHPYKLCKKQTTLLLRGRVFKLLTVFYVSLIYVDMEIAGRKRKQTATDERVLMIYHLAHLYMCLT